MKPAVVLLGLVLLLDAAIAAEETCEGRCGSFNPEKKCQCDSMCLYYGSCCDDFATICPKKVARGDAFEEADWTTTGPPTTSTVAATAPTPAAPTPGPTTSVDPNSTACSGQPFDAFLQLKNGSIYAFRGDHFFELDDKSVLPGYPKLIQDVWGIPGPIDAAFTRVNCQGKSYIFKGDQYWRFDGDVLDEDYPRTISVGFDGIPNGLDAAFAVPAPNHLGKEKAYFFKGDRYYQYEFKHQPTHEECVEMTKSSPSVLFERYTDLYCDQTWEEFFSDLFGSDISPRPTGPRLTRRDWLGITPPLDAAIVGRVHNNPKPTSPPPTRRQSGRRKSKKRGRARYARYAFWEDLWGDFFDYDYGQTAEEVTTQEEKSTPVQNVYFFKKDKYYRVDLQTKRVSNVRPPYPRSIAKYWLGCKEETPDTSRAEKK